MSFCNKYCLNQDLEKKYILQSETVLSENGINNLNYKYNKL